MSESQKNDKETPENDKELNDLLDSALEDLDKKAKDVATKKPDEKGETGESAQDDIPNEEEWSQEFIRKATSQFETNMASLLGEGSGLSSDQFENSFRQMIDAASQVRSAEPTPESTDFATTITQTLQGLSQGAESIQNPFSEQQLLNMFGGLNVGDGSEQNAFLPFMQGMMQSLLSKEILYPSLKDIVDKFPSWLEQNKGKIEQSEYDRYAKQKELMEKVCSELETEKDDDSTEVKKARFEKVLELMQKMQDLGQPPTELVGDLGPGMQFDPQGNPLLPGNPDQCPMM